MKNNDFIRPRFIYSFLLFTMYVSTAFGQTCYTPYKSQTGITALHDQILDSMSCEVISAIDSVNFKVIGLDLYPVYAYVNPADGYDKTLNQLTSEIDSAYTSYIAISKEMFENAEVRYGIHIKWGTATAFESLSDVEKATIKNVLTTKAASEYERLGSSVSLNAAVELAILKEFMRYVNEGVDVDYFDGAGFDQITLTDAATYERGSDLEIHTGSLVTAYNYMGYMVDNIDLGEHFSLTPMESYMLGMSVTLFITSNDITQDENNLNTIRNEFEAADSKIKLWLHFDFEVTEQSAAQGSGARNGADDKKALVYADNNLTEADAAAFIDTLYAQTLRAWTSNREFASGPSCGFDKQWGKKCIFFHIRDADFLPFLNNGIDPIELSAAAAAGLIDGLIGLGDFLVSAFKFIFDGTAGSLLSQAWNWIKKNVSFENFVKVCSKIFNGTYARQAVEKMAKGAMQIWNLVTSISYEGVKNMVLVFWDKISSLFDSNFANGLTNAIAYYSGMILFEVILAIFTAGIGNAIKGTRIVAKFADYFDSISDAARMYTDMAAKVTKSAAQSSTRFLKCKILRQGCFIKDTPVLMASNSFSKSGKTYALAAAMPFIAMPIQEVPLLSWTVAHETVNENNNLIASTDEDLYLGLLNEDPYTSDQQRQRDKYELNNTNWYRVSFVQIDGTSKCHFALHDDWIKDQGYESEKVVILNLPEQGINGPFRVTSIKHIIPQKKPESDAGAGYDWKPVTALFEHQSNQVYTIDFDNGEQLGVTYQHPIFSTTENVWKLAGELEVGEKVLTYKGEAAVTTTSEKEGSETVYNLEVKELHNFLVGEFGIVVHNNCYKQIAKKSDLDATDIEIKKTNKSTVEVKKSQKELGDAGATSVAQDGKLKTKAELFALWAKARKFENIHAWNKVKSLYTQRGQRITLKVTKGNKTVEIVPDFVVKDGNSFKIIDAKFTTKANADFTIKSSLTKNQNKVFEWMKNGDNISVKVTANQGKLDGLGLTTGDNISLSGVDIIKSKTNDILNSDILTYF